MIPEKIRPFFEVSCRKNKDGNELIKGTLTCCASHDFEVFAEGEIKCGVFSKLYLLPENDRLALNARCKKCGRDIPVFDNSCDGYEKCESGQPAHTQRKNVECIKCRGTSFSVDVTYEYPEDIEELKELGTEETDNAFTWIWVTLKCRGCGTVYRSFIDYETA